MVMPVSAGGWDMLAGPGGHLQKALQAWCDSAAADPGKRASYSQRSDPASSNGNEAAERLPRAWRFGKERKYLALLSFPTTIPELLSGLSSAPFSAKMQRGRSVGVALLRGGIPGVSDLLKEIPAKM